MNSTSLTRAGLGRRIVLTCLAAALGLATVVATQAGASAQDPVRPTQSQVVSGVTAERVVIKTHPRESTRFTTLRLDFVSGAATPWHSHTGPGLVTIIDGTFVLTWAGVDGCTDVTYQTGDSFVDAGDGTVHRLVATSAGSVSATLVTPADQTATAPAPTPNC